MSYESKLARSVQSDYRRDAAIEREYGTRISVKGALVKIVATVAGLAVIAELLMQVAAA